MDELSMRARDAAPVTWAELKVELLDLASAVALIALRAPPAAAEVRQLLAGGNGVFAQLLTVHLGRPPAGGSSEAP